MALDSYNRVVGSSSQPNGSTARLWESQSRPELAPSQAMPPPPVVPSQLALPVPSRLPGPGPTVRSEGIRESLGIPPEVLGQMRRTNTFEAAIPQSAPNARFTQRPASMMSVLPPTVIEGSDPSLARQFTSNGSYASSQGPAPTVLGLPPSGSSSIGQSSDRQSAPQVSSTPGPRDGFIVLEVPNEALEIVDFSNARGLDDAE